MPDHTHAAIVQGRRRRRQRFGAGAAVVLAIALGAAEPEPGPGPFPPARFPARIAGTVEDDDGRPLPGARVTLTVERQTYPLGSIVEEPILRREATTDAWGRYEVATDGLPAIADRPFTVLVTAEAPGRVPWQTWTWYGPGAVEVGATWRAIRPPVGREVEGRVVDRSGAGIAGAVVVGDDGGVRPGRWAAARAVCDDQGRFRIRAPGGKGVGLWAATPDHTPSYFALDSISGRDAVLRLAPGAAVAGTVRGADGRPLAGVLVASAGSFGGDGSHYRPFRVAAKTDREGRYRLPPLVGEHRLFVTGAAMSDLAEPGAILRSEGEPPPVPPAWLTLPAGAPVDLRATSWARVEGAIRDDRGRPAPGVSVKATAMPEGNGVGLELARAIADDDGTYTLRVPAGTERLLVNVEPDRRDGQSAVAKGDGVGDGAGRGYARLPRLDSAWRIDFEFRAP